MDNQSAAGAANIKRIGHRGQLLLAGLLTVALAVGVQAVFAPVLPAATSAAAPSSARPQNDVLSVEWLEQHRQSNPDESRVGSRGAQPLPDNYIGFTE